MTNSSDKSPRPERSYVGMSVSEARSALLSRCLSLREAQLVLTKAFAEAGLPLAGVDAKDLVLAVMGETQRGEIFCGVEAVEPEVFDVMLGYMERRLTGEPVDHILGSRDFFGERFKVTHDVLSPRGDTENLLYEVIPRLEGISAPQVLDLGTGSGAIGLTVLNLRKDAQLLATDISSAALEIARINAARLNLTNRVTFRQGSWWEAVPKGAVFDMILSNPPYITDAAMEGLETEVKDYDPEIALRGGVDGLDAYRLILEKAADYMKPHAWLGFEIGFDQGPALQSLLAAGPWVQIELHQDLSGLDRVVWARKCD